MNFWSKLWRKDTKEEVEQKQEVVQKQELSTGAVDRHKPEVSAPAIQTEEDEQFILLEVEESAYEASRFDIDFKQEKDSDGRPDGSVYGGIITLTLKETVSESMLHEWLAQTRVRHQGSVRIYSKQNGKVSREPICHIIFKDACCTGYRKHLVSRTSENVTEVKIAPRYLKIGNEEFENNWRN